MKRKTLATVAAIAFVSSLAGCALLNSKLDPSPELEFTYATTNGPATGLVRAFVLNGSTVLQFVDITQAQPKVYAADQPTALPYQVIGQYAILSGVHSALRVTANGATATVTATRAPASSAAGEALTPGDSRSIPAAQAAQAPAVTTADLVQHEAQELARLRKEVAGLRQQLGMAPEADAGAAGGIVPIGSPIKPAALIVPARDAARSWALAGNRTLKDNMEDMARQAGYTLTWKASNPFMVTYTKKYQGTFQDAIGEIAKEVPALDFRLYTWKRRLDVVDATD